jgi:hypothetical protein
VHPLAVSLERDVQPRPRVHQRAGTSRQARCCRHTRPHHHYVQIASTTGRRGCFSGPARPRSIHIQIDSGCLGCGGIRSLMCSRGAIQAVQRGKRALTRSCGSTACHRLNGAASAPETSANGYIRSVVLAEEVRARVRQLEHRGVQRADQRGHIPPPPTTASGAAR